MSKMQTAAIGFAAGIFGAALTIGGYQYYLQSKSGTYKTAANLSEGMQMFSQMRVSVEEYYMTQGRWPYSNRAIGFPPPGRISGKVVSSVEVMEGGVVAINYKPEVVGQPATLVFTPTANHGGGMGMVDWKCKTDLPTKYTKVLGLSCTAM